ncbi:response regulator [Alteromonas sp. ASW11-36]|uniref:Response regulator n=1 Tax=Alteromonas arenosi TaxID=3055817 RepID=A0ABT7SSY0_9ALTE|nr:response regulator [Alteromonas sp. ASW11-36]MDM7859299.1 response regulator [Alteromonas sp. ASW11-36]
MYKQSNTMMTTAHKRTESSIVPTLLLVDDEPDILAALQRCLRKEPFTILTAANGVEAKACLQSETVHILMTDLRMPGMDGESLLEYVAEAHPSVYRIVLTGYAELASVKRAVNNGHIQCYLEKPWENATVVSALDQARFEVENKQSERRYIQKVTSAQKKLTVRNSALEKAVVARTKQLRATLKQVQNEKLAATQMLFNMLTICPHLDPQFALNVSDLCVKIARCMQLPQEDIDTLELSGKFCEIGLIGVDHALLRTPINKLNFHQQQLYFGQVEKAEQLLAPVSHLEGVLDTITQQFEQPNGYGSPMHLSADQIVVTASILAVARDVWLLASGRLTGSKVSETAIRSHLEHHSGKKYAEQVVEAALQLNKLSREYVLQASTPVSALTPGMTLSENLYSSAFLLIFPKGHVLTERSIKRLLAIESNSGELLNIHVADAGSE